MSKSLSKLENELKEVLKKYNHELRDNYTGKVDAIAELAYKIRDLEEKIKWLSRNNQLSGNSR